MPSQASSNSFNHEYRAAIALNNIGVALLEKGRNDEASGSLKEALGLLRMIRDPGLATSANTESVDQKVRQALSSLFRKDQLERLPMPFNTISYHQRQTLPTTHFGATVDEGKQLHHFIRIELEHGCSAADLSECDVAVEAGILLYNLAIATVRRFQQGRLHSGQPFDNTSQSKEKNLPHDVLSPSDTASLASAVRTFELVCLLLSSLVHLQESHICAVQVQSLALLQLLCIKEQIAVHGIKNQPDEPNNGYDWKAKLERNSSILQRYCNLECAISKDAPAASA